MQRPRIRKGILTRGILTGILTAALALSATVGVDTSTADVIVRGSDLASVTAAVEHVGGAVEQEIGLIHAVAADVPTAMVDDLTADPRTHEVTPDGQVTLTNRRLHPKHEGYTPREALQQVGGQFLGDSGWTGHGVDIAVIDTGVERGDGLDGDAVEQPVDLSLDGSDPLRDGFGHGTVMGSIAAARWSDGYAGIARDAELVDVKVGAADGVVDVSQVLAGIDWVVSNRDTDGRDVRVLLLAFGTDGTNPAATSPLSYAVQAAWRHGITVVTAAGNHGDSLGRLAAPAIDPYVIAVGALDTRGTDHRSDDTVPEWSAVGDGVRNPDLVAPGRSIIGAIGDDTVIARENPDAREGRFIRGSGTSQAAAFVAGVVADMLHARPDLTPDQVKAMLVATARDLEDVPATRDGAGSIDVGALFGEDHELVDPATVLGDSDATQDHGWSDGTGSLDGDRGSYILEDADGTRLTGEHTVVGEFDREQWLDSTWTGSTWTGSTWTGSTWTGSTWTGSTWTGSTWTGSTWTGSTWTGSTWTGSTWTTVRWGE